MRKILQSRWPWIGLVLLAVAAMALKSVQFNQLDRPTGTIENDLDALRERDDVNVLFVLIDTLRADRLSGYGYDRATSPTLDALAETGIRFAHVEGQSSWTKASMASLWTGMYPARTGIQRFGHAVPDEAEMPAEVFRDHGFTTGGIWRNGWVADNFGFGQGFDLYLRPTPSRAADRVNRNNPSVGSIQGTDLDATESAIEFLRSHRDDRFFLYVHYMDVHQYLYDEDSTLFGSTFSDFYDNSIHWTDRNVGFLLGTLQKLGIMRKTLVVIAADHGEGFFEHGQDGHARTLYREVQEVPLIVGLPFRLPEPVVVEDRVANIDIFPTVFDLLGMEWSMPVEGRSLVPLIRAAAAGERLEEIPRPVFSQLDRAWGRVGTPPDPIVAIVTDPYRMIVGTRDPEKDAELFDRTDDPLEQHDLVAERPEVAESLRREIAAFLAIEATAWDEVPTVELSDMDLAQLRALGYVIEHGQPMKKPRGREKKQGQKQKPAENPKP